MIFVAYASPPSVAILVPYVHFNNDISIRHILFGFQHPSSLRGSLFISPLEQLLTWSLEVAADLGLNTHKGVEESIYKFLGPEMNVDNTIEELIFQKLSLSTLTCRTSIYKGNN